MQVTHDISHLTCADVFRAPGVQTPVITRFSTVIHERGSPESLRDPRGFAVKFYTREGNWDLVGNNMPVFFIRDGIKFPDMIHALKPNPKNHLQEDWRIADFFSHVPEAMHMVRIAFHLHDTVDVTTVVNVRSYMKMLASLLLLCVWAATRCMCQGIVNHVSFKYFAIFLVTLAKCSRFYGYTHI